MSGGKRLSQNPKVEALPTAAKRVLAFANFFKSYMSIWSVIVAALPLPITLFQVIPTFAVQTNILSVYTSLFCFLELGFIFFIRHKLAPLMFPEYFDIKNKSEAFLRFIIPISPLMLILMSLVLLLCYHYILENILLTIVSPGKMTREHALLTIAPTPIQSVGLMIAYLGIFITAESAFILMSIKEYLQDLLKLSDLDIMFSKKHLVKQTEL